MPPSQDHRGLYRQAMPGQPWRERRRALRALFEAIEPRYDHLNRWLSAGIDRGWRRWAVRSVSPRVPGPWLDLASGTGDLAVAAARSLAGEPAVRSLVRSDLSPALLQVGARKLGVPPTGPRDGDARIASPAVAAEMDRLPFGSGSLAAVLQGFALRHCEDYPGFFRELHRVLRPGGQIAILDMRYPRDGLGAGVYRFYFARVLPRVAGWLGADRAAYQFMVDSVLALPDEDRLLAILEEAGFQGVESRRGFLGAVRLLLGWKAPDPLREKSGPGADA